MDEQVKVSIDLLERVFPILIRHLRELEGGEVHLDYDPYWSLPLDQVCDVYQTPTDLDVGQITECIEWLTALSEDPERALAYHLVWLADVLRAMGQAIVK